MTVTQHTPDASAAYTAALRSALVEHVAQSSTPHRRRRTVRWFAGLGALAVGLGGATAAAASLGLLPGSDRVETLAEPVVVTVTGPQVVDLGARPDGATHLEYEVTCLSTGSLTFPDGAAATCDEGSVVTGALPVDGSGTAAFGASADLRWRGVFTYSHREATQVGVNANGDTYGISGSDDGDEPDLVAVQATNGREGYAYARDLAGYEPTSPADAVAWQRAHEGETRVVPVYLSDGETVVGELEIGSHGSAPSGKKDVKDER